MASEYLKWKYRDVQPEEKVELTPAQKRRNWWHYHKWHLAIGAVLACVAVSILLAVLGVGRVDPDYQIAYVGTSPLPDGAVSALEEALASLGADANGDGRAVVHINQYAAGDASADGGYYALASATRLMADLTAMDSYFFLLEDPEDFQRDYGPLRALDGSLPDESGAAWRDCCLRWTDCPALTGLELGSYEQRALNQTVSGDAQALFAKLYVARRGFWTEDACENVEACDAIWDAITRGANP